MSSLMYQPIFDGTTKMVTIQYRDPTASKYYFVLTQAEYIMLTQHQIIDLLEEYSGE